MSNKFTNSKTCHYTCFQKIACKSLISLGRPAKKDGISRLAVEVGGARWDAAKKFWYVKDVADLTPFSRWIPDLKAATEGSSSGAAKQSTDTGKAAIEQTGGVVTGPAVFVPHCGCNVQPWEDCEHTVKT